MHTWLDPVLLIFLSQPEFIVGQSCKVALVVLSQFAIVSVPTTDKALTAVHTLQSCLPAIIVRIE